MTKLTSRELQLRDEAYKQNAGRETEDQFESAMTQPLAQTPPWFYGLRDSTREDDNHGTDRFAILDIGEVRVQIKRNPADVDRFWRLHPSFDGIVVVVQPWRSLSSIRQEAISLLRAYRHEHLRKVSWKRRVEPVRAVPWPSKK